MFDEARALGLDRVLIICEVDRIASVKTITNHGGVLEDVRDTELGAVRRDWIKIWFCDRASEAGDRDAVVTTCVGTWWSITARPSARHRLTAVEADLKTAPALGP